MTGTPSKDRAGAKAAAIANLVDIAREEGRKAGFAEGMKRAAEIARGVGSYGDYKREELTIHYGQPRFDMMHDIVAAILSEAERR